MHVFLFHYHQLPAHHTRAIHIYPAQVHAGREGGGGDSGGSAGEWLREHEPASEIVDDDGGGGVWGCGGSDGDGGVCGVGEEVDLGRN